MLLTTLIKLNQDFIAEAIKSPTLLSDMAAMERYMSESYSERLLIELIQNADDAKSTKIILLKEGNDIIFANNGRDFTEDDILAICRSGASSKQKGTSIGYRGIGFKSASYLADDITIISSDIAFSFSKEKTAQALGVSMANVPTIRVPFLSDMSDYSSTASKLKLDGYTTLFVFRNANVNVLINEVSNLHKDVLLFLNNICEFDVFLEEKSFKYVVSRQTRNDFVEVRLNNNSTWGIFDNKLGIMMHKGKFVKCEVKDALYSCFLPTYDTAAYPVKINADFPTDPSRKHIIINDESKAQLDSIAQIIGRLVQKALMTPSEEYSEILDIFSNKISFSVLNQYLSTCIKNLFSGLLLSTNSGKTISISEYKILPPDMENSIQKLLREESVVIQKESLSNVHFNVLTNLSQFLGEYSTKQYSLEDIKNALEDAEFVRKLSVVAYINLMKYCCEHYSVSKFVHSVAVDFSHIYVNIGNGVQTLKEGYNRLLELLVKEGNVPQSSVIQFLAENGIEISLPEVKEIENVVRNSDETGTITTRETFAVPRWRSAENICIDVEVSNGNKAEDVSRKNLGYDVLSITPAGEHRYIEVKAISKINGEFSITNNEYTTAHQYGDKYILCLILQGMDDVEIIYISNPIKLLNFEKRIRQWDWLCNKYDGEHIKIQYK